MIALGADIGEPGGPTVPLDRRLKLAACPSDVLIDPPVLGAATLRCAEIGWRIRVPLVRGGKPLPAGGNGLPATAAGRTQPRAAPVIRRGDPVDLVAGDSGFAVSTPGDRRAGRRPRRPHPRARRPRKTADHGRSRRFRNRSSARI